LLSDQLVFSSDFSLFVQISRPMPFSEGRNLAEYAARERLLLEPNTPLRREGTMKIVLNGNGVARQLVSMGAAVMSIFATVTVNANDIGLRSNRSEMFDRNDLTIVSPNAGGLVNDGSALEGVAGQHSVEIQGLQLSGTDIVRQKSMNPMTADSAASEWPMNSVNASQSGVGSLAVNPGAISVDASRGLIPSLNLRDSSTDANWVAYSAGGQSSDENAWLYTATLVGCVTVITVLSLGAMVWIWRGN
jgi:hypothetical protein